MGLTVNRQMAKKSTVNRQNGIFLPSNERAKISRFSFLFLTIFLIFLKSF